MPSFIDPFWVITSYYNPAGYRTRRDNFKIFRKHLNAPLLVVELARSGEHHLTSDDGDIVLDLVGEDRIWQKERLLNIAVAALPPHVEYVAWIDCDVVFEDEGWAGKAQRNLARHGGLIQLFETAVHLPPQVDVPSLSPLACAQYTPAMEDVSIVSALDPAKPTRTEKKSPEGRLQPDLAGQYHLAERSVAAGIAWAANRATMAASGFYDRNIIGGGDSVQTFAALTRLDEYFAARQLTKAHQNDARLWADHAKATGLFSSVGSLDTKLYHLWHGTRADRNYRGRYEILYRNKFDPNHDIRHSQNGTWMWSEPQSSLANEVGDYFFSRREDAPSFQSD